MSTLDVGPVEPVSARVWIHWTHDVLQELRSQPASPAPLPAHVLDSVDTYLDTWERASTESNGVFSWHADVDPEELEYVTNAFYNLDVRLSDEVQRGDRLAGPAEGRLFHLVLVRALLCALDRESPTRAAFSEQLRRSWPGVAEVE